MEKLSSLILRLIFSSIKQMSDRVYILNSWAWLKVEEFFLLRYSIPNISWQEVRHSYKFLFCVGILLSLMGEFKPWVPILKSLVYLECNCWEWLWGEGIVWGRFRRTGWLEVEMGDMVGAGGWRDANWRSGGIDWGMVWLGCGIWEGVVCGRFRSTGWLEVELEVMVGAGGWREANWKSGGIGWLMVWLACGV